MQVNGINLMAIFVANGLALLLATQLLFGSKWRFIKNRYEHIVMKIQLFIGVTTCIIDPIVFIADGHPGVLPWLVVYFGNMFLFLGNLLVGPFWLLIIINHLIGRVAKFQKILLITMCSLGLIVIIANFFVPIVFSVDANSVYHRGPLFWFFTAIEVILILDGMGVYIYSKLAGGIFKFFPVMQFLIPIIAGIALQSVVYGISVVWPTMIISFVGLLNSMRDEAMYIDSLTGLYNRLYMDTIGAEMSKKGSLSITAMMLDLNDFKEINDKFGHAEGDIALIKVASILNDTIGALGCAVRYAGDEFVILLNTTQPEIIEGTVRSIHREMDEANESGQKEYKLSASIGYCALSENFRTLDEIVSEADRCMYVEKAKYYQVHERRGKRG